MTNVSSTRKLKKIVTLITEAQAKVGTRFSVKKYDFCKRCKLFNICLKKLKEGVIYEVVNVRKVKHICPKMRVTMRVVEVVEAPKLIIIPAKNCYVGAIVTYNPINCNLKRCPYYNYCCNVKGLEKGEKIIIEKIVDKDIKCPLSKNLKLVWVRRLSAFE